MTKVWWGVASGVEVAKLFLAWCRMVAWPRGLAVRSGQVAGLGDVCRCGSESSAVLAGQGVVWLAHLYICDGLSTYRIGQVSGLDRQRVARLLRRAGVVLRPRGAGGRRPERRRGDPPNLPELLAELYVHRHLTTEQAGAVLGIPARTVRDRLRRYGICPRTRGGWEREQRRVLPASALWDLYCRDGLSADEVGRRLRGARKTSLGNTVKPTRSLISGGACPAAKVSGTHAWTLGAWESREPCWVEDMTVRLQILYELLTRCRDSGTPKEIGHTSCRGKGSAQ